MARNAIVMRELARSGHKCHLGLENQESLRSLICLIILVTGIVTTLYIEALLLLLHGFHRTLASVAVRRRLFEILVNLEKYYFLKKH